MYNAIFYTQDDFDVPDDEFETKVYWGEDKQPFCMDSNLERLLTHLRIKFSFSQYDDSFCISEGDLIPLEPWRTKANALLKEPTKPIFFDLAFVEQAWMVSEDWNHTYLLGVGKERWIAIIWRTTA